MQLNEITSGRTHDIETLRAAWKRTKSGQTAGNVIIDNEHELEYYLATALFSSQMRLGELKAKLDSVSPEVRDMFETELSAIENDLSVCAEGITLLVQERHEKAAK